MTRNVESVRKTSSTTARLYEGEVISDKMDKTIVVKVYRILKHPLVGKTIRVFKKYKAHDEEGSAKIGDWVEISECRPFSKTKHAMLSRIVRKAS